ncbi:general substrate transporter [Myxozyma melibiosi]|uniref:General substrate transporter n=1 Tax=Myxozyma melibiosi TaxID=54550 RepID=A0ABR1F496_9ASCO
MAPLFEKGSIVPSVLIGAFTTVGGILYGYDTGIIAGILAMDTFKRDYGKPDPMHDDSYYLSSARKSLVVSILAVGLFSGAFSTGNVADRLGRRKGLILACIIFMLGVSLQVARGSIGLFALGRLVAGFGVGSVSSIGPLYQAEIAPKHLRGAITAGYHTAKTLGVLIASLVDNGSKSRDGKSSYLIPIYIQFIWVLILLTGFLFLPESPRFLVKQGKIGAARRSLSIIRHNDKDDISISVELAEIEAAIELERALSNVQLKDCFGTENRQRYRMMIGLVAGAMSQLVGVNFIKYFGTDFFLQAGITDSFMVSVATNMISFCMTLPSIYLIEKLGRRPILTIGLFGCFVTQYVIAVTGLIFGRDSDIAKKMLVVFTLLYIAVESCGAGPPLLVVMGETFPLRTRAKSISLSIGCDYIFNFLISYTTPFLVDDAPGSLNMGTNVFFIWGTASLLGALFIALFVYETKGLTLEQIDELYMTCPTAWRSSSFKPAANMLDPEMSDEEIATLNGQRGSNAKKDGDDTMTLATVDSNGRGDSDAESIDVDEVFEEEGDPLLNGYRS